MTKPLASNYQLSDRTAQLKQSGIRSVSKRCAELKGFNLGQGVCDIPIDDTIKAAAAEAINANKNLYAASEGVYPLRQAIAKKIKHFNQVDVDPETEILVAHGATGAYVAAVQVLYNPGDEVILFEPFYGYHKGILELFGVTVKAVPINRQDYSFDMDALTAAISNKTRGIVICSPGNPSGKVFTKDELIALGELAKERNLSIITDEIYEYFTYPGHEHVSLASINDYAERTVTLSGFSKTYNMTGWRLGYAYGPAEIINKMGLVHDLVYVCPPTPLQHAVIPALDFAQHYYDTMRADF